jgi:hypothetical protein
MSVERESFLKWSPSIKLAVCAASEPKCNKLPSETESQKHIDDVECDII